MQGGSRRIGEGRGGRRRNPRDLSPPFHRAPRRSRSPLAHFRSPSRRNLSPLPPRCCGPSSPARRRQHPRRSPSPLPAHHRSPHAELQRDREHCERGREYAIHGKQVLREDNSGLEFQHKYMLPDHPTDLTCNLNPNLQLNRSVKDRDLLPPSGIMGGQSLLLQKSMFFDDGLARTYFSLPQDNQGPSVDLPALNPSGSARSNIGGEMHRYHERLGDPYDDIERNQKDALFSNAMAPVQPRLLVGSSSSSLPKDGNFSGFYGDRDGIGNLPDAPLKYNEYGEVHLPESLRRAPLSPAAREEWLDYGHGELSRRGRDEPLYAEPDTRRGRDEPLYAEPDTMYRKVSWGPRGEYRDTLDPSFSELAGERGERADASQKKLSESSFWDLPRSSNGDTVMDFGGMKGGREEYNGGSGSGYMRFRMQSPGDRVVAPFEEGYSLEGDVGPMAYRGRERANSPLLVDHHRDMRRYGLSPPQAKLRLDGRSSSPMLVDHHMDMLRHGVRLPRDNSRFDDHPSMYDLSPERMVRRKYWRSDDVSEHDSRGMLSNDRNIHRRIRIRSPDLGDETWSNEEDGQVEPYITNKAAYGHSKYRMPSHRISRKDGQAQSDGFYARAEGHHGMSLKKRLRPGPSEFHVSLTSQKRQVPSRPNKFWKRGLDDRHDDQHAPAEDVPVDGPYRKKSDPPENSEEYKHQVHKAFLRFTKLLNESPHQRRRYQGDQARTSNLLCCVCGSASKEFVDTHGLLAHTYHSLKPGLRTEHLGFHKALCLLMGWNFLVPADASKAYVSRCDDQVKALKEDLILWPPVVIINNSSIGNKNSANGPKVISVEAMENILKGMGFEVAKGRLCIGKPSNHSVLLVKFLPTFSGLQEAERLHKYYADNKRGREEFKKMTSVNGSTGEASTTKDEELMYGFMAIAEDLEKLDPETKKRCHVKSKKDIEAIADAPLNTD